MQRRSTTMRSLKSISVASKRRCRACSNAQESDAPSLLFTRLSFMPFAMAGYSTNPWQLIITHFTWTRRCLPASFIPITCREITVVLSRRRIAAAILSRHVCSERWAATRRLLRLLDGRKNGFSAFPTLRSFSTGLRAAFEGQQEVALAALQHFDSFAFNDGEGLFYVAEIYARLGLPANAYKMLERSVAAGFWCLPAFELDPYLAPLREDARWRELLNRVRTRQQSVRRDFLEARGRTRFEI